MNNGFGLTLGLFRLLMCTREYHTAKDRKSSITPFRGDRCEKAGRWVGVGGGEVDDGGTTGEGWAERGWGVAFGRVCRTHTRSCSPYT